MGHLQELKTAQNEYTGALVRLASAKYGLKRAETEAIVAGVEGKNQSERDANLMTQLSKYYLHEHEANMDVIQRRGTFENASRQFEFDGIVAQYG